MNRTMRQRVRFSSSPRELYEMYLNSREHTKATGGTARIRAVQGSAFSAWDGYITGRNLLLVPHRRIVQSWRASDWSRSELDSLLVLDFIESGRGTDLRLEHLHVPARHAHSLAQGWRDYYWRPWKAYLRNRG